MFNPVSTYRLQFHESFTLEDLRKLTCYFEKLGVKTLYASPVFRSAPGSKHGYDGVNPNQVNPEIGTTEQLKELAILLDEKKISWLQDLVPNHMAFHHHNEWLMDLLEKGKESNYASYFDHWNTNDPKIMAPFLEADLKEVIEDGKLSLVHHEQKICFEYSGMFFPLNTSAKSRVLQLHEDTGIAVNTANDNPGLLLELANTQYYQLTYWKESETSNNYRRFFTVTGLICLNVQRQEVFNAVHKLAACLLEKKVFKGLRIDHIDGLYDPGEYLSRLRALAGEEAYLIVEKILEPGETLPAWPIQGNTGYDFLGLVNNLLTNKKAEQRFTEFYNQLTTGDKSIEEQIHEKKAFILYNTMGGELEHLCSLFQELITQSESNSIKESHLKKAIGEFLIHCPVYRYYGNSFPLPETEANGIKKIIESVKRSSEELVPALSVLEKILLQEYTNEAYKEKAEYFYKRCMQFTGPLMAKGVEDTLMYTYNRFIAHNEVGDSPAMFGLSTDEFHQHMIARCENWPLTLNATSTHDTKRGEEVRARLNVLSDLSEEWIEWVTEWQELNKHLKKENVPDQNDEYFIYQTLIGSYPFSDTEEENYEERLKEYIPKALREAKTHSQWSKPNDAYEKATINFTLQLLNKENTFWKSFKAFSEKLCDHCIINSLTQLILKHTCPGIPDTYQGTELWDLSLVDPDNRRPVDYSIRQSYLEEFETYKDDPATLAELLWKERKNAKIKLYVLHVLLCLRKQEQELFEKGMYVPLQVKGKHKDQIIAFARRYQKKWCVVALPLHTALLELKNDSCDFEWGDTQLLLPDEMPLEYENIFLNKKRKGTHEVFIKELVTALPFAVIKLQHPENQRSAGVLMPVSALPSIFSIGDLGPGAKSFVGFLSRSSQTYWQLLPLNPTEKENGYSPYSSSSSMAGNELLISLELLVKDGLLTDKDLEEFLTLPAEKTDYENAFTTKATLLKKAFDRFNAGQFENLKKSFHFFVEKESYWLEDFACYKLLKHQHNNAPWFEWAKEYRTRNAAVLTSLKQENSEFLNHIYWKQFVFHRQWQELKQYCHTSGIKLFGDLPFYVSHDSADVWANQELFSLDEQGAISGVAGVPPDYFSKTGQLWNVPTFRWEKLKQQHYKWWIDRLSKNMQLFDLLRIDHFRALAEYWEVPAGEETAVNGKWHAGIGEDFFNVIKEALGDLPFVAEDLGDNMEKVYELREAVGLPGMKVLQFAFGDNLTTAVDAPHNFITNCIVYTGTHDNNTTLGWYRHESTKDDRKRIGIYTGKRITEHTINDVLADMAYASVAKTVILPMQDLLGLDENSRMNTPGSNENNWLWRLKAEQLSEALEYKLRCRTKLYNRL